MSGSPSAVRPRASYNGDLLAVAAYLVLVTAAVLARGSLPGIVTLVIGAPLVAFVPGYAFVAALFPGRSRRATGRAGSPEDDPTRGDRRTPPSWLSADVPAGITVLERVGLAVVSSFVAVAAIGLVAALSPWGISAGAVLVGIVGVTVTCVVVAVLRRERLPAADRFGVSLGSGDGSLLAVAPGSFRGWLLVIVVCASVLAATGAVGYAWTDGDGDAAFYLLTENEDGELVAGGYPESLEPGESTSLVTAVENHESRAVEYVVVVTMERTDDASNGSDDSNGSDEEVVIDRYAGTVAPGQQWTHRHDVAGQRVTGDFQLHYYLYEGSAPEHPSDAEPRQRLQLSIDVPSE